jgi:copper homeostasis protein
MVAARPVVIEAAVDSLAAAIAAEQAGADRIELCGDLDVGGVTPAPDLQRDARRRIGIPLFTMVRPRGGSFTYRPDELDRMIAAIREARALGAAGIVTGAIGGDGRIDRAAMRRLIAASRPLPVTFHKAFDALPDLGAGLEVLVELGVERVLTSGGAPSAAAGAAAIVRLVARSAGRIGIVAGGGVSGANVAVLVGKTRVSEVHARCESSGTRIRGIVASLSGT